MEGPITGAVYLSNAQMILVGENNDDKLGSAVSVAPDIDLDGFSDLVVGASHDDNAGSNAGAAYILLEYTPGTVDAVLTEAKILGDTADEQLGTSAVGVGDVNGDGAGEVLVGVPFYSPSIGFDPDTGEELFEHDKGKAFLVFGGGWSE
jgi:hypothetical protein